MAVAGVNRFQMLNIVPEPAAEAYRQRVLPQHEADASDDECQTVGEQLSGSCTTEIAAFREFAALLAGEAIDGGFDRFVLDTAPTGHSLLLMDATGAYHRQMTQKYEGGQAESKGLHIITPFMRLLGATLTHVAIFALSEVTPVSQAAALKDDLRRAKIEP